MKLAFALLLAFIVSIPVLQPAEAADGPVAGPGDNVPMGCLPTCSVEDGRFLAIASGDAYAPLSGPELSIQVVVPAGTESFTIGIFDGDTGGVDPGRGSHWDRGEGTFEFRVVADGGSNGQASILAAEPVFSTQMPDNDWFFITVNRVAEAMDKGGTSSYRLHIVNQDPTEVLINSFKVAVRGKLLIPSDAQPFAIFTALTSLADARIVYPNFPEPQPSTYDGSLEFFLQVPAGTKALHLWDGDLDFGDHAKTALDLDDPDTPPAPFLPPWATTFAVPEGVAMGINGGTGNPADDADSSGQGQYLVRSPSPAISVQDPRGRSYANLNPSGNREWEQFRLTTSRKDPEPADFYAKNLPGGLYSVSVKGIDFQNLTFWRFDHPVVCLTEAGLPCARKVRRSRP